MLKEDWSHFLTGEPGQINKVKNATQKEHMAQ